MTGVQTCALPIWGGPNGEHAGVEADRLAVGGELGTGDSRPGLPERAQVAPILPVPLQGRKALPQGQGALPQSLVGRRGPRRRGAAGGWPRSPPVLDGGISCAQSAAIGVHAWGHPNERPVFEALRLSLAGARGHAKALEDPGIEQASDPSDLNTPEPGHS